MSQSQTIPGTGGRIEAIDLARGVALVAMAIYHFAWDLEFLGYAEPGMTAVGGWKLFARCIATSFLVLAGVSLVLAHGDGVRWRGFVKRFAMVAGAAAAISLATWIAVPDAFIFFGILHQIAFGSLVGLAFLRLPWWVVAALAVAILLATPALRAPVFEDPWLWWTGLSPVAPRSNDFVPVFPWFAAVLAGVALGLLGRRIGLWQRLRPVAMPRATGLLRLAGRNSLAVYLVHQPVLIGCLYLFSLGFPAARETPQVQFRQSCERTCGEERSQEFCSRYCVCVLDAIESENRLDEVFSPAPGDPLRQRLEELALQCTMATDEPQGGETTP